MSKILKGSAFTYGTKTDGSAITISINGGSGISMFQPKFDAAMRETQTQPTTATAK